MDRWDFVVAAGVLIAVGGLLLLPGWVAGVVLVAAGGGLVRLGAVAAAGDGEG